MAYIAIKDHGEHFKKGDIVGMNTKTAKEYLKKGLIQEYDGPIPR